MALRNQEQIEAQFPDRFEDAGAWLAIADNVDALTNLQDWTKLRALGEAQETARLAARYLSLQGIEQAKARQNTIAIAMRAARDPITVSKLGAQWALMEDAQKSPDRRNTWRRWMEQHDLIPTSAELQSYQRRVLATRKRR